MGFSVIIQPWMHVSIANTKKGPLSMGSRKKSFFS